MDNRLLRTLGKKLNITSEEVLQKAIEYARFVDVRCGSGSLASLNMSGSCSAVVCLEIAAQSCGFFIDKKVAIKLSGMAPKMYMNAHKAIECILGKQKHFTIKDLAVMYGCVSSVSLAEQLLNKNQKVRVDKTKLINQINEKRSLFDKVCKDLKEALDKMPDVDSKKTRISEKDKNEKQDDDYEKWKLKMLGEETS